ncbi:MAG: DUF1501 domain-containing protein, partial [Alphaproteobacteria bacterium]|nr:DUF1501 domain-containing protein [Alphaproteobacteria bacterium]
LGSIYGSHAQAAGVDGYKALVCVFLLGGMDNHDTVIPYDQSSYDRYAQIRSSLISASGGSRDRANLLALSPDNASSFDGREFALPPQLSGIQSLFQQGNAAIVGNVGPLIQATTKTQFDAESVALPARLFSHNDQQSTWQSSSPEGAQFGWGGRFADAAVASGANTSQEFTNITSLGNELFLTGQTTNPYQVSLGGAATVEVVQNLINDGSPSSIPAESHFRGLNYMGSNLLERDMAAAMQAAYDANALYNDASANAAALTTQFPTTFLGQQLSAVARSISVRGNLGVNRQVFFVGIGGFDTHDAQATSLPLLHTQIDGAVTAFYQAMQELNLGSDVTLFTASDFGRTLAVNGNGTDHGWGSHHFVVGDAVQGRQILGDMPISDFGHDLDSGGGRLIPSTSVEQFAAPMGRWFGLNDSEVLSSLPNRANFSSDLSTLLSA